MIDSRSNGLPPRLPPERWEWPCICGTRKDDLRKVVTVVLTLLFSVTPGLLLASGGEQVPLHSQVQIDCPGWSHVGHEAFDWVRTSGLKQSWFPVGAILIGIFFWKGGSIRFKGRGLVSGRARARGE